MNPFKFASPTTTEDAVKLLSNEWDTTAILAGGTDLMTSLKQGLLAPQTLVSLQNVEGLSGIAKSGDTLTIGATTTLSELIANAEVNKNFPALVTAARNIGSQQILNRGTVGGDLLQRPRCWYYRNGFGLLGQADGKSLAPPGDNRYHAIFGNGGPAYFVNPSSLAPALIALRASLGVQGPDGSREIEAVDFFLSPKREGEREHALKPNEILTQISVPIRGLRNATYEIRPRKGLDWPMVAAAAALDYGGGKASNATIVLGHVAPVPWLSPAAAAVLDDAFMVGEDTAAQAGEAAAQGAKPLSRNGYKVHQVKVAVKRAIMEAIA